jgi:multidrug resistance efflux pump
MPATPAPPPGPAPAKSVQEDLEADASRLLNDLPTLTDPENAPVADGQKLTVAQAKVRLARAQQKLQRWEKLFKDGVLSQSEVERCTVELADALARYEHSNLEELRRQLAAVMERSAQSGVDQTMIDAAKAGVASAQTSTARADAQLFQTKFDLAKVNLERQKRLYEEKLISRAALEEAEGLVRRLQEQKESRD